jgi:signal transduction histidine kinase
MSSSAEEWRGAVVATLLAAIFTLIAFVALRGLAATRDQRRAAEQVVRDWTLVAVDELVRRAAALASFEGTYHLLLALSESPRLLSPTDLAAAENEGVRRAAPLAGFTFRFDAASGELTTSAGVADAQRAWLRRRLAALAGGPAAAARDPLHAEIEGERQTFVLRRAADGGRIDGLALDLDRVGPFFERAALEGPLVPASVAGGAVTNEALHLRALAPGGRSLLVSGAVPQGELAVHRDVAEGLLRGAVVEGALDPRVAPLVVAGGLSGPAAVATYLVPLLVAALLLGMVILQLRRERAWARRRAGFLAAVSHELRTPLAQIRLFAETLRLDRVRSSEERRRSLAIIDQEARRLTQLVDNVLLFSRGERRLLRLDATPLDLPELVRETVAAFAPLAEGRQTDVETALQSSVRVVGDAIALRQVLVNLLDNAVKYGPPRQRVLVSLAAAAGRARLAVEDQGPGVPSADRRRIFRRYERLEREGERGIAGAGIGLAVVHELVHLHGGTVWAEAGPGGGARFVVEVPAEADS